MADPAPHAPASAHAIAVPASLGRRPSFSLSLDERYPAGYSLRIVDTRTVTLPALDPISGFPLPASASASAASAGAAQHGGGGIVVLYCIAATPPAHDPSYSPIYTSPPPDPLSPIDESAEDAAASPDAAPSPDASPESDAPPPPPLSLHWKRFSEFVSLDSALGSLLTDTQRLISGSPPALPSKFSSLLKKPDDPELVRARIDGLNVYLAFLADLTHAGTAATKHAITGWLDLHRNASPEECVRLAAVEAAELKAAHIAGASGSAAVSVAGIGL